LKHFENLTHAWPKTALHHVIYLMPVPRRDFDSVVVFCVEVVQQLIEARASFIQVSENPHERFN